MWAYALDAELREASATTACGRFVAANVVDDDIRAGVAQRDGDGLADAGVRAGHQRLLSLEQLADRHIGHDDRRELTGVELDWA